ncbi:MAG: 30S ribosome-binding factor RbfA [Deltaproteobacteria bacterium]|nr:30S ribosome-binding factor RbfA [Deltaproteobacteria bacterium]
MATRRSSRVGEQIKREISQLIARGLKDPRVGFVTITDVEVSPDLRLAKVYYSVLGDEASRKETAQGLKNSVPFLCHELGQRIRLRYTPKLVFIFDASLEYGAHMDELLRQIAAEKKEDESGYSEGD